ncbi:8-amino-7-oxononanoate synthase [Aquifex sp.]
MRWIEEELKELKEANLYRKRILAEGIKDFCSNDYLGLRKHPEVIEESERILREYGLGSGASQLVSGYTRYHKELEEALAEFKGIPSCVLFGSGFLANVGTIPALVGERDIVLSDALNHASIIDGVRLSKAERYIFRHKDYDDLEEFLAKNRGKYRRCLIITDTVFSMDGDIANLRELYRICESYECMLYIDEAHATGVLGDTGRGGLEYFGLEHKEFVVVMETLSKALGGYGAFVCGTKLLTEYLINKARSLIFSTSLPPHICGGLKKSIEIIKRDKGLIKRLRETERKIIGVLRDISLDFKYFGTPIIPLMVYSEREALKISKGLMSEGVFIQAIRYPTVPRGQARLRLTASLNYTDNDIDFLKEKLKKVLEKGEGIRRTS